jgi:hypothetical protein
MLHRFIAHMKTHIWGDIYTNEKYMEKVCVREKIKKKFRSFKPYTEARLWQFNWDRISSCVNIDLKFQIHTHVSGVVVS